MHITDLIPKHKDDSDAVAQLEKLSYPAYKEILPELFVWIQDMNWPIARRVVPLLTAAGDDTIPIIKTILEDGDQTWQYWILDSVVVELPVESQAKLAHYLKKISTHPTPRQQEEEVDVIARKLLKNITPV